MQEQAAHAMQPSPAGDGSDPSAWAAAATKARGVGRPDLAARALLSATALRPRDPEIWFQLAQTLGEANDPAGAESAYRRVLELLPAREDVRVNIGAMLERQHRYAEAAGEYRRAARHDPSNGLALNNLAGVMALQGRADEAMILYRRAVRGTRSENPAWSNYLYAQHYCPDLHMTRVAADHLVWGAHMGARREQLFDPRHRQPGKEKLKVGYLSPNMNRHSVAYFLLPLLEGHDRRKVSVWCYSTSMTFDPVSERLRKAADAWVNLSGMSDIDAATQIMEDGVDVLIDLAGHTAGGRLGIMAHKPAPIQAAYIGYPNTTGLSAIDLRISDVHADPSELDARYHSEKLVRTDRPFLAYAPPEESPVAAPPPALKDKPVTFGSFNNLAKVSAYCLDAWAETMRAVPDSRLLLKARAFSDMEAQQRFRGLLAGRGVKPERVDLRPHAPDLAEHLKTYAEVDIALDTWPYNGATTTMEALWMGVPVVSMTGEMHAGRVGASLLNGVGLSRFAVADKRAFAKAAMTLADDFDTRLALRNSLRNRIVGGPLGDGKSMARALEDAFFDAWARRKARPGQ